MKPNAADKELVDAAIAVRVNAHAPYSGYLVGSAVRVADGRTFVGVNVENCSYGLTVCAERNAVAAAVAAGCKAGSLRAVAVVVDGSMLAAPCGACRQVLVEVAGADVRVVLHNLRDGRTVAHSLKDLLPEAFKPSALDE